MSTRWSWGLVYGGTTDDGWGYETNNNSDVSRAWRVLPDGKPDPAFPDQLKAEGPDHAHAIFDAIAEQIIEDEDRETEMRKAS